MHQSIADLMAAVHCRRWPARWEDIYTAAMQDLAKNGCPYIHPDYYSALHARYGCFPRHLSLYREAAEAVGRNEALTAFLYLMCYGLATSTCLQPELDELSAPALPHGAQDLGTDMVTGLAICSQMDTAYTCMRSRGLPDEIILPLLASFESGVDQYAIRHGGAPGYHLYQWYQRVVEGKLYRIGSLSYELGVRFTANACIFENAKGEQIALADGGRVHRDGYPLGSLRYEDEDGAYDTPLEKTADGWLGHRIDGRGRTDPNLTPLSKKEWHPVLQKGDPVISLHISAGADLSPASVDRSLAEAREFLARYFPDQPYAAFICYSWLADPTLGDILGEDSNIVRFGRRYRPLAMVSEGEDVFYFLFGRPHGMPTDEEIAALPRDSRLRRGVIDLYEGGGAIYEYYGIDTKENTFRKGAYHV